MHCRCCFLLGSLCPQPALPFLCLSGGALKSRSVSHECKSSLPAVPSQLQSSGALGLPQSHRYFTRVFLEESLELCICTLDSFRIHFRVWKEVKGKTVFLPWLSTSAVYADAFFSPLGCWAACQASCSAPGHDSVTCPSLCPHLLFYCGFIRQCFV